MEYNRRAISTERGIYMDELTHRGRIWAEVNLDALAYNLSRIREAAHPARVLTILKADAYGHGMIEIGKEMERIGADYIGVAAPCEALALRQSGVRIPILLLGPPPDCDIRELADADVTLCCPSLEHARRYMGLAARPVNVHIKIETGMTRLGFDALQDMPRAVREICEANALPGLRITGAFTHFCASDDPEEDEYTRAQYACFCETVEACRAQGVLIPLCHCSNSAAIGSYREMKCDMVRAGSIELAYNLEDYAVDESGMRPLMTLKTRIMQVKQIKAGTTAGYGRTWRAERDTTVATVGIGYADGYPRAGSNKHEMLVNGTRVKQIGRVCMDITMLDVTGLTVSAGDVVTVVGADGGECITFNDVGACAGSSAEEVSCNLNRRVPRLYLRGGVVVAREGSI